MEPSNDNVVLLAPGALASASIEVLKMVIRKLKGEEVDFPPYFYGLLIPFLTAVWQYVVTVFLVGSATVDLKYMLYWAFSIVVSLITYKDGIKPFKDYAKAWNLGLDK